MKWDQLELNPRIITAVQRAEVKSFQEILVLSAADLQRKTRLSRSDVQQLQSAVAASYQRHTPVTALQVYRGQCPWLDSGQRLSVACPVLDALLRGGLPLRGLSELAGPSGAGKTQLALQLCLSVQLPAEYGGLNAGAVYICTEDPFPIRRLMQLISHHAELRADVPDWLLASRSFSDNIYVEHMADLTELQLFLNQRLSVLLSSGRVRLVVLDSVAALFRSEFTGREVIQRSRCLLALAATLHRLSHAHNTPVLCLNQVTDVVDSSDPVACSFGQVCSDVLPALGLVWANQVMVRLMLRRLRGNQAVARGDQTSALRRLQVVFAPHLPTDSCLTAVWREGVTGVRQTAVSLPSGSME